MKKLVIGILAHVDAGKTTLSERLLYLCGVIRQIGRVDHGDTFLDNYELEKERGITIFSKQAILKTEDVEVTLLDTPGHVDFSAEMERTLQVLDYAILVINGMDGVQSHTMTLWRLLERYQIPTFLFVNKMDQNGTDHEALLADLKAHLHENCVDFGKIQENDEENTLTSDQMENIAVCDETLLEKYLETGSIEEEEITELITQRKIFPCYFGSALKEDGVEDFWNGVQKYTREPKRPAEFGAKVFKIARDEQGNRLTYMKITGGSLKAKTMLSSRAKGQALPGVRQQQEDWEEKADQLRLYSGAKYTTITEAEAGTICAVTGLTRTYPGEGLGIESESELPVLEPVLNYQIQLPDDCDPHQMLQKLRQLEEEEPELHILWDSQLGEIHAQLMGEVQIEILKKLIWDRFHVAVEFGTGSIVYKETVAEPVEGVGHFEPLRHYAEVHLLIEPGEPGSGMVYETNCSEDLLSKNWQRLIITHLEEKHKGVLTGSELTDTKITLIAGRAHIKHTEGGDFRQATYRAVRQGLMQAKSRLLEPVYAYRLEIPSECIGRAMTDIQQMCGTFSAPEQEGELSILSGTAPVSTMRGYQREVVAYSRGHGRLFCTLKGYAPCHNEEEVVERIGYLPEADLSNTPDSVFCAHGAGFVVPWYEVPDYMHIEGMEQESEEEKMLRAANEAKRAKQEIVRSLEDYEAENEELKQIFERTYGPVKVYRQDDEEQYQSSAPKGVSTYRPTKKKQQEEEYLLVDGYNIIFGWPELNELSKTDIAAARLTLMDILSNYQGYSKCKLILVFDAYKVPGGTEHVEKYHNIYIVYTKEAETADQYIEKTVHAMGRKHRVTVATSDGLEQVIILGQGGVRMSALGLKKQIESAGHEIREMCTTKSDSGKVYLFHETSDDVKKKLDEIRLEKNDRKNDKKLILGNRGKSKKTFENIFII